MMHNVAGLDPSLTGFAVCIITADGDHVVKRFSSKPLGKGITARMQRVLPLIDRVMGVIDEYTPRVICIEGYAYGANVSGVIERAELGGILRADLINSIDADLYEVAPNTLKKFVTGKGAGDKTAVIAAATSRWGVTFADSDSYDAYGLARMAQVIAGAEPENEAQRNAVAKVKGVCDGKS